MRAIPEKIQEALDRIKKESSHYVSIKVIRKHTYVYESTSKWDKERKKVKNITKYLGRITKEGVFIPGIRRDPELETATLESSNEGIENNEKRTPERQPKAFSTKHEAIIIASLSKNGRISLPQLSKLIGLKLSTLDSYKKNLERKYDMRYIPEVDVRKLGLLEHLILIKFEYETPSLAEMKKEIEKEPYIQLALLTQGDYDLVLYFVFPKDEEIRKEMSELRERMFAKYDLKSYLVPFSLSSGFIQPRDELLSILGNKKQKNNDTGIYDKYKLSKRESIVLRELNKDGSIGFPEIDSKNKLGTGSSGYTYNRLLEKGIIKKITVSLANLPIRYNVLVMIEKLNISEFNKDRDYFIKTIFQDSENMVDKYTLIGETTSPEGILLLLPIFSDDDLNWTTEELRRIRGIRSNRLIVTNIITGNLCYRRLNSDNLGKDAKQ